MACSASAAESAKERLIFPIAPSPKGVEGWKIREWKGRADFEIVDTEIGKTLHLRSDSTSYSLYREYKFDIRLFPVLHWSWKAVRLPKGADARKRSTDDQAAQLYVVFPRFPEVLNSRIIGYIWDTTVPAGLVLSSAKNWSTKYIVIKGTNDGLDRWYHEKRNVYEDYKRLFREEPPMTAGVSVLIDSDDTKSSAESYIGDIYFLAK